MPTGLIVAIILLAFIVAIAALVVRTTNKRSPYDSGGETGGGEARLWSGRNYKGDHDSGFSDSGGDGGGGGGGD